MLEIDDIYVYDFHENSLIVDKFERKDVWPTTNKKHSDILVSIKQDLFQIFDLCKCDIREFLNNCKNSDSDEIGSPGVKLGAYIRKAKKVEPLVVSE
jgi:hypothetical protein